MVFKSIELYQECFEASEYKKQITLSHLPFRDGYYVVEYGIVLMVRGNTVYRLEEGGWIPYQSYIYLWYDGMDNFADIPDAIAQRLRLDDYEIKRESI